MFPLRLDTLRQYFKVGHFDFFAIYNQLAFGMDFTDDVQGFALDFQIAEFLVVYQSNTLASH